MALLHGLHTVNQYRRRGWSLHVAHLDHNLPHNAADMAEFVQRECGLLDIPYHGDFADVPALSKESDGGIEEVGRQVRYAFLQRIAEQINATHVATAHHADDQAETVLAHVLRGSGLRGLSGMPRSRPLTQSSDILLVRPLLDFQTCELSAYLQQREKTWMHDASNDDLHAATRNRIRHEFIPSAVEHINPSVVTALNRLATQAARAEAMIAAAARDFLGDLPNSKDCDEIILVVDRLIDLPEALLTEVIVQTLKKNEMSACRRLVLNELRLSVNLSSATVACG